MSSSYYDGSRTHSRLASVETALEGGTFGVAAGRSTPSALAQKRRSKAVFCGDESDSEEEKAVQNSALAQSKSVASTLQHVVGSERSASCGETNYSEPAWPQHDEHGCRNPTAPYRQYLSHDGTSSAAAYELPYQDSPINTPSQSSVLAIRRPTNQLNTFPSRKSLLDPTSFGFDAQNGDPRVIMREKGNDIERARPASKTATNTLDDDDAHIELITVPGLGAEYSDQELAGRRGQKKRKQSVTEKLSRGKQWIRSKNTLFCCFTPRLLVIVAFIFATILSITLYFVIPRVPSFAVQTTTPLEAVPNGSSMITHHSPTNFSMDMNVNMRADNTGNWVPITATKMTLDVTDLSTLKKVGKGTLDGYSFAARKKTIFKFPIHFAYASINVTGDQTWSHWINACGPKYDGTPRQSLNLQFTIQMGIRGLIGTKGTSVQLADLECPFTLQNEQV